MASQTQAQPESTSRAAEPKPGVLIVDDSRLMRYSLKGALKDEFQIIEAVDGEDGWEKLIGNEEIRVVITDQGMPRLDGYGLIKRIRASNRPRIRGVPIMMVTGAEKEQTHLREEALKLGATDFIIKPFDNTQILARARSHARLDQASRNLAQTEKALEERSALDPVTNAYNQRYFMQQGAQAVSLATRHHQELSLLCIDLEQFNRFSAAHGEDTAKRLLKWVADTVKRSLRQEDTLARTGASRFSVLVPATGRMEAAALGGRIREHMAANPFQEGGVSHAASVRIGLANLAMDKADSIESLQRAGERRASGGAPPVLAASDLRKAAPKVKPISLDTVLKVFHQGNQKLLTPHLKVIALNVLPLLELCNETLKWELDRELGRIRAKLAE